MITISELEIPINRLRIISGGGVGIGEPRGWARPGSFRTRINIRNECWEWTGSLASDGYGVITIEGKQFKVHRVIYSLLNGPIAEGLICCHRCDNPPCVNPNHIFLGTELDNARDAVDKGRSAKGVRCHLSTLNDEIVALCRKRFSDGGITYTALAKEYGVAICTMHSAITGRTWRHVK